MKKTLMIFAAIVMMAGFSTTVMAQTSATVGATPAGAELIVPMTLAQTSPLHFGTLTLKDATGGTVVLSTANVRTIGSGTGVEISASNTPPSTNAAYNVTGTYNQTYALTLPTNITVTEAGAVGTMIISALTVKFGTTAEKTAVAATSVLSATGTDSFIVGGTLTVAASQIGGVYAGTFAVTVDYN